MAEHAERAGCTDTLDFVTRGNDRTQPLSLLRWLRQVEELRLLYYCCFVIVVVSTSRTKGARAHGLGILPPRTLISKDRWEDRGPHVLGRPSLDRLGSMDTFYSCDLRASC